MAFECDAFRSPRWKAGMYMWYVVLANQEAERLIGGE